MITLTVKHRDGSEGSFQIWPETEVAFERHFKTVYRNAFQGDFPQEHVYYLAWLAERDNGIIVKPFDDWMKNLANIDVEVENENPI